LRNKVSIGEYLAFLSLKYEVDPDRFFYALNSAWENKTATCGELLIQCRSKTQDKAIFLMTRDSKVVSQFPIPNQFLLGQANPIKTYRRIGLLHRRIIRKPERPYSSFIKDLKVGMKKINLKAKVLEIPKPTLVFTRFGNYASVSNASVTDETGTIKLCLWNEQISTVSVGDVIQIENAHMSVFRGQPQLRIGKSGKLNIVEKMESASSKIEQFNISR
jgi:replication factor A1